MLGAYLDASLLTDGFQTELWREARLTLPQLAVLRSLRDGGPQTAGRLGETVGLSPASATRLFDRLEERGLIRRHRGSRRPPLRRDPPDRRAGASSWARSGRSGTARCGAPSRR